MGRTVNLLCGAEGLLVLQLELEVFIYILVSL